MTKIDLSHRTIGQLLSETLQSLPFDMEFKRNKYRKNINMNRHFSIKGAWQTIFFRSFMRSHDREEL